MPSKRRLVISEICFGTEKAGLLDFSYNKCALENDDSKSRTIQNIIALSTRKLKSISSKPLWLTSESKIMVEIGPYLQIK